jgi:8-oxo-dGTP pyrophosphatase MutT (NUDIX family)
MKRWLRERALKEAQEGTVPSGAAWLSEDAQASGALRRTAVAVMVVTPAGIPLVWDSRKAEDESGRRRPVYWKLPGGKSEPGEVALAAAVREVLEETGIPLDADSLGLIAEEDRGSHDALIFRAESTIRQCKLSGDEGEVVRMFSPEKILGMRNFFSPHRRYVEQELIALR